MFPLKFDKKLEIDYYITSIALRSWDSSVGIATGWTAGFQILAGVRIFSSAQRLKWPGREADHSPLSNAEV
jgi:hypothetical protein